MQRDYMFKPRTKPMATFKKGSKRYNEMVKARVKQRISKVKEVLIVFALFFVCSVDLEPLLDMLLG